LKAENPSRGRKGGNARARNQGCEIVTKDSHKRGNSPGKECECKTRGKFPRRKSLPKHVMSQKQARGDYSRRGTQNQF